jgi:conjugal transfer ATP-binding protein TraC
MAAPDGNMDNFQMSVMSQILLKMCVDSPNEASITLFAEMCNKHEDQRVRDIGAQLYDFTIHGKYARLFDRRLSPTIRFSSRFIVAELGQLKAQPNLQTVVLMSVIQQAQDAMFQKDDGRRRAFILDEAWEYITDGAAASNNAFFAEFIEAGWRRFRKTQAMGVCITQQVSDYYSSRTGKAIFANSPWLFTLAQEGPVISRLKTDKLMDAPNFVFNLMESVRTDKGMFSELMIQYEGLYQVMRLYMDDRSMTVHTTDPDEKKIIKSYIDKGCSPRDAIIHATEDIKRMRR